MQSLKLANDVFDKLGVDKSSTLRRGKKDILLGKLKFYTDEPDYKISIVNVTMVFYCKFIDLPIDFHRYEGYKSKDELFKTMQRFYPDFKEDDICTVIYFN